MVSDACVLPEDFPVANFRARIVEWYREYGRSFPWRHRRQRYPVLIAEILLHRTRADKVAELYEGFLERWPTSTALADAPASELQEYLYPLGLRWRVEHLHQLAREVVEKFDGEVPIGSEELEALPGVGHYIAAAVRCFAAGKPEALVDTNTIRIAGRVFDLEVTDHSRRSEKFHRLMAELVDRKHPREFNFGLLDLGARICTSDAPQCSDCPVQDLCVYGRRKGC